MNRPRLGSRDRRRPSPSEIWKILRAGNPLWDPKIVYEAIGKDRNDEWDTVSAPVATMNNMVCSFATQVFMVSSLNHHISILKLRVHPLYVQHLTQGTLPKRHPSDPSWCSPSLQRTRWFDLFSIEDRTEAMRGIWGIMAYMMRSQEKQKQDVQMKESGAPSQTAYQCAGYAANSCGCMRPAWTCAAPSGCSVVAVCVAEAGGARPECADNCPEADRSSDSSA